MSPRVLFEDEADAEYRLAGRWYEERREWVLAKTPAVARSEIRLRILVVVIRQPNGSR